MFGFSAFSEVPFSSIPNVFAINQGGGDPAPLPMIGLVLQFTSGSSIIPIIMNQLRQQGIA